MLVILSVRYLRFDFTYIIALESIVDVVWDGKRLSALARDKVIYVRILRGVEAS
jgi:hypothetical protein